MGKRAVVLICAAFVVISTMLVAPAALASPAAHAPRFVGTYRVKGSNADHSEWRLDADGSAFSVDGGVASYLGSWSNTLGSIRVDDLVEADSHWYWIGQKTGRGLSTKRNPGTFSVAGTAEGTWYAIKTG